MLVKTFLPLLLLLLSACAAVEPLTLRDPKINLAWPYPPNEPRIRFLRSINGAEDISPPHGKIREYFDFLAGESEQGMKLELPFAIAGDGQSVIYIADTGAGVVHRYDLKSREVGYLYLAGDDVLSSPVGVAVDSGRNLYVSDSLNGKVYKYDKNGKYLKELNPEKPFLRPAGIAVNSRDEKYVVDVLAHKLYIFDKDDHFKGDFPREIQGQQLSYPSNVAFDSSDNVYVTDAMNFTIKRFSPDGVLTGKIGDIGDAPGSFARPKGIALDGENHLYAIDAALDNFQIFNGDGKLLLLVGKNGWRPGEFYLPSGIYIDKQDHIFIADTYNSRIQVFQFLREGAKQ
ncbi:6-bladed beta-propeller [Geotalea sp. SG265]|uniref:6-bladed beta-propeller n=1 Tax=Geotalea sp. SG265 TaxID=2922867 RepID=UPI001FAEC751|nr:6-bladed beta-propeller [Geotalea sp. SG265]